MARSPVDRPDTVEDQIGASNGQQAEIGADLVAGAYRLQVGAHPRLVGDDPGILRIGLAIALIGRRGVVNDPARDVEHVLPVVGEQRDQQRRAAGVQIGGPHHLTAVSHSEHRRDQLQ